MTLNIIPQERAETPVARITLFQLQSQIDPKRVKDWFLFENHVTISAALAIKLYGKLNVFT